jgi:RNA polymerase sigma factor (sigma-70 family)
MYALIERMQQQDETALEALYELTISKVFGLALKITRRHDLAEDVVGDTYWQAWIEAGKYDELRGEPIAWLMLICRSRAIDALRRLDVAESHPEPTDLLDEHDHSAPVIDILLTLERDAILYKAMEQLSNIQRQLIALAFFRGYSHQEIAKQHDLPLGTVKSHIKRAQDTLKRALEKEIR